MSVLESIGAAMPGVGFALGGLIAALVEPAGRRFWSPGLGVFAIVVLAIPLLGRNWPQRD